MNTELHLRPGCPDCRFLEDSALARRDFLFSLGQGAALAAAGVSALRADTAPAKPKPAEDLVRELHKSLSAEQRAKLVRPWDEGGGQGKIPTRMGMYNSPLFKTAIGTEYTKPQQELVARIFRAVCSDDEGYRRLSRNGKFDGSGSLAGCGAHIFGDPTGKNPFSWVFTGHHLTLRCDGNSVPGTAFGGPLYYGHSAPGYSERNVFQYQTRAVQGLFAALDGKQQKAAVLEGSPGEQAGSVKHRERPYPGIGLAELSKDQQKLVESVMRDVLSPYRKEDADEVMDIVRANGGMTKLHLAYYKDKDASDPKEPWHFWRLEGPGFVWNYRVLDHVHCFVNIARVA